MGLSVSLCTPGVPGPINCSATQILACPASFLFRAPIPPVRRSSTTSCPADRIGNQARRPKIACVTPESGMPLAVNNWGPPTASETHATVSHLHTLHYDKLRHAQNFFFCARVQFLVLPVTNYTIRHCVRCITPYIDAPIMAPKYVQKVRSLAQAPLTHRPRAAVPLSLFPTPCSCCFP